MVNIGLHVREILVVMVLIVGVIGVRHCIHREMPWVTMSAHRSEMGNGMLTHFARVISAVSLMVIAFIITACTVGALRGVNGMRMRILSSVIP